MEENLKKGSCFFAHKWTKWVYKSVKVIRVVNGKEYNDVDNIQKRECVRCGKMEVININY